MIKAKSTRRAAQSECKVNKRTKQGKCVEKYAAKQKRDKKLKGRQRRESCRKVHLEIFLYVHSFVS